MNYQIKYIFLYLDTLLMLYSKWYFMSLQQIKYSDSMELGCALSFSLNSEPELSSEISFDAEVDLFGEVPEVDVVVEPIRNCIISPSIFSIGEDNFQVEILPSNDDQDIRFVVRPKNNRINEKCVFELPNYNIIKSVLEISEKGITENRLLLLEEEYDCEIQYQVLLELVDDAKRCLSFPDYTRLLNEVSNWNREVRERISAFEHRHMLFSNMMLGDSQGRYYSIKSQVDLRNKIDLYESRSHLAEIHIDYILKLCLRELDEIENKDGFINFVNKMQIANEYASILRDYQVDLILADAAIERNTGRAQTIILNYISKIDTNSNYDELKEKAKTEEDYRKKTELWFKLLRQSIEEDKNELNFVLANYLYWRAELLRSNDERQGLIEHLHQGSYVLFKYINMSEYAQRSKYNYHLRCGFRQQDKDDLKQAISSFTQALKVAANDTGEWEKIFGDDLLIAAEQQTRAEHQVLTQEDDSNSAIELIDDRVENLRGIKIEDLTVKESVIGRLRADRHRIKADQNIQNQQYKLAIENIEECIKIYSTIEDNKRKMWAITRKKKINAFIAEREGDFSQATQLHKDIANRLEEGKERRFYEIRVLVCEVKSAILQDDLQLAREKRDSIREMVGTLRYEIHQLSIITALLTDYQNSELTGTQKVYENISSSEDDRTKESLQYEYDYASAITILLAAQRLRQYDIDRNLLDAVVNVSLEDAFRSPQIDELIEDTGLKKINIEQWVYHLPTHILINIEQISMRESAGTGEFSDVTMKLLATLEQYLEILAEYYGKQQWGEDWKEKLSQETKDRLALGDLYNLFNTEAVADFEWDQRLHQLVNSSNFAGMTLVNLRNSLDHGRTSEITQKEYNVIKENIFDIIKTTARDTPVIFCPREDKNIFNSYSVKLEWGAPRNMVWLTTEADLSLEEYYFLPPQVPAIPSEVERWSIDSSSIRKCTGERTLENT